MAVEKKKEEEKVVDKKKALEDVIAQINKAYGKGSIMPLGENRISYSDNSISTGCLAIDVATGIGGIPRGRITEIFGPESSGKTTLALQVIAQCQRQGGVCAFIDAENALDPQYAEALGVDLDSVLISQPDDGDQAINILRDLVNSGAVDLVVVDSVAALVPKAELEGDMENANIGQQARLMSKAMRMVGGVVFRTNTCVIFINQLREKVGVMFGSPETTPGGRALKFYASMRIDVRKTDQLKTGGDAYGNKAKIKIVKNKMASPFKTAEVELIFGKGFSNEASILDMAIEKKIVEKSGSWFSYNDEKIAQGKEKCIDYLENNPEVFNEIENKVREAYGLPLRKEEA
ncbi:MAG: recombinase RecA [Clostridia bacterium]|nr:recombinase RecA [Clostridia bacterium]